MARLASQDHGFAVNPIDLLEELVGGNNWRFDRCSESELTAEISGRWCGYRMYFVMQPDMHALFFSCHMDMRVPETKKSMVCELLALINESLWLGHFDLVSEDGAPLYRHTLPLRGAPGVGVEQLEDLVDASLSACERFYPALQLVIWGGRTVADALGVARMDTVGEA